MATCSLREGDSLYSIPSIDVDGEQVSTIPQHHVQQVWRGKCTVIPLYTISAEHIRSKG